MDRGSKASLGQHVAQEHARLVAQIEQAQALQGRDPAASQAALDEALRALRGGWLTPGCWAIEHIETGQLATAEPQLLRKWYGDLDPLGQSRLILALVDHHGSVRNVADLLGLTSRRLDQILHLNRLEPELKALLNEGAGEWRLRSIERQRSKHTTRTRSTGSSGRRRNARTRDK